MNSNYNLDTYTSAVVKGEYDLYRGGLWGKHDNVRIYWEDQMRIIMLRSHFRRLVERKRKAGEKTRIVDLGCGTGQGLQLLTTAMRDEPDLSLYHVSLLPYDMLGAYVGIDINEAMVTKGKGIYSNRDNVFFYQGDLSKGFPLKDEPPYDMYFSTYSSPSHLNDEEMERLFLDIVHHAGKEALFVGDWLGKYSIEWPCYWDTPPGKMCDYSMSWLHLPGPLPPDAERFPMRYWSGNEIKALVKRVEERSGAHIEILSLYDCSILVGRHVDTGEYNKSIKPLRHLVNRLHEDNIRTDLEKLKVEIKPVSGHKELNKWFRTLAYCWNTLIDFCEDRLTKRVNIVGMKNWHSFPPALQMAIMTIDRVVDTVAWIRMGDPRGNIIESQIGYTLRGLELELQQGRGCGHSIIGIFKIVKG